MAFFNGHLDWNPERAFIFSSNVKLKKKKSIALHSDLPLFLGETNPQSATLAAGPGPEASEK